uniref:SFRICE_037825 n=1 Tax=Spodoptera frugiperda TaxID=7108 RepID=A0A2H1X3H9_SPOFR
MKECAVSRSASFSKLRESLRRSSARLFSRLAGRHSAHLPTDVDFTDPESMKRASSLSALSNSSPASPRHSQPR